MESEIKLDGIHRNPMSAGYKWLVEHFKLQCIAPRHQSEIAPAARKVFEEEGGRYVRERFPADYAPGDTPVEQLVFALKYDGVELQVLAAVFAAMGGQPLVDAVRQQPTSKYLRQLWFFYEWLREELLELPDLNQGNYVDALDPDKYFVVPGRNSPRHRVRNNLSGTRAWCPVVRRTDKLKHLADQPLAERVAQITRQWDPELLRRAVQYLYTKETRSSFEIEREEVTSTREAQFVDMLQRASKIHVLDRDVLVELQRLVVDPRFFRAAYREDNVYVGETRPHREIVHYIAPRPEAVPELMAGFLELAHRIILPPAPGVIQLHPVIAAAIVSFGFVYIHPFDDGNGRIHRFLIHYVLSRMGFSPPGLILPVSAAILQDMLAYDTALEDFSRPLRPLIPYQLDAAGRITILADTVAHYRYIDLTAQTEALFGWVKRTIEEDLIDEMRFLESFERARGAVREVVRLPDRLERLFIRLVADKTRNYSLSRSKRASHFSMLSDDEVARLETAVRDGFTWSGEEDD